MKTEIEQIEAREVLACAALAEGAKTEGWKTSAIAGDIATLGVGTVRAAAFNTMPVFLRSEG